MEPRSNNPPLVVIVGQTASGKSALALSIAERWNGEIIAADSRTIYRGMDIGTAKPSAADRARVPHHLIDVVDPDTSFTARDFQRLAQASIADITARGRLPILAGGTGLYVDAVIFNFGFRGGSDRSQRALLETFDAARLQEILVRQNLPLPENAQNPRHLIRAIERAGAPMTKGEIRPNTLVIGLELSREVLKERVTQRLDAMLAAGLEQEVISLAKRYGWVCPPMQTIGYQEFRNYAAGQVTVQEVRQAIITHTVQYAKRQKTWFKRNQSINWISKTEEAVELVTTFLNK